MKRTVQQFVQEIEKELLIQVMTNLDQRTITEDRAQALAKEFLQYLPVKNKRALFLKMRILANHYKEASKVYYALAEKLYKEEKNRKVRLASKYIHEGDIDHAVRAVKGGLFNG